MSHCLGVICKEHQTILLPDTCPERGCPGQHGYTFEPCAPPCPQYNENVEPVQ